MFPMTTPTTAHPRLGDLVDALPDGAVLTDPDLVETQSRDHTDTIAPGRAVAAVLATCVDDVVAAVKWADANDVPVVTRGAGSGLAGASTATDGCLVLSVSKMRDIEINAHDFTARVQPGAITADVDAAAAEHGLMYAPDPSSLRMCSIGGNLATNAGGLRCVKYGVTRAHVRDLTVVLPDGRVLKTGQQTVKGVSGLDLVGLFVGSEGTLGVIVEATVALLPRPVDEPTTILAGFADVGAAMDAVAEAMRTGLDPELMEFMDRNTLRAIDDWKGTDYSGYAGLLLAQVRGADGPERGARMAECFESHGAVDVMVAETPAESDQLVEIRRLGLPAIERMGHYLTEDMCVPRSALSTMMRRVDEIAADHGLTVYTCAHAGDGNLHPVFVWDDRPATEIPPAVWAAAQEMFREALALGGTLTGEHGVGTLKQTFLAEELGEVGVAVQRAVKAALDPKGLFNPGKALA